MRYSITRTIGPLSGIAGLAAMLALAQPAGAQEFRSGSAIAGVAWPVSSYDWPDTDGSKRSLLDKAADLAGAQCGPETEYNAWRLDEDNTADDLRPGILSSYRDSGWTLSQPVRSEPDLYLGERNSNRVLVWLYHYEDREALALYTCLLEGSSPATKEEYAAALTRTNLLDASSAPNTVTAIVRLLGGLSLLIAAALVFIGMRQRSKARDASNWTAVPGEIISGRIDSSTTTDEDGDETTWLTPVVSYRYMLDSREYTGNRIRFGSVKTLKQKEAEETLAAYPVGANVNVHVNPAKPEEATLELTVPGLRSFFPFAAVFAAVGAILLIYPI